MKLNSLEAFNLFSYEHLFIDFTKFKPGLILIEGIVDSDSDSSNGAAKTSIGEIINWCLFDNTIKEGIQKDEIIHNGCSEGKAVISISHNNKVIKINKERVIGKTNISIIANKIPLDIKNPTAGKEYIESLLNIDFNVWKNSIFLGQNSANIFVGGTSSDRIEMFGNILNFKLYDKCLSFIRKIKLKEMDSKQIDAKNRKSIYEVEIEQILNWEHQKITEELLEYYKDKLNKYLTRKMNIESSIEKLKEEKLLCEKLKNIKDKLKIYKDNYEEQENNLSTTISYQENNIKEARDTISRKKQVEDSLKKEGEIQNTIFKKNEEKNELYKKLAIIDVDIKNKEAEIKKIKIQLLNITNFKNQKCKFCGNLITEKCRKEIETNLNELNSKYEAMLISRKEINVIISKVGGSIENLNEVLEKTNSKDQYQDILNAEKYLRDIVPELKIKKEKLLNLKSEYNKNIIELNKQKEILENSIHENIEDKFDLYKEQLKEIQDNIDDYKKTITIISQRLIKIEDLSNKLVVAKNDIINNDKLIFKYQKLERFFGKYIKFHLVNEIIGTVEDKINNFFSYIDKGNTKVNLNMQDKCDVKLVIDGLSRELELLSGGERKILSILFSLAFSDIVMEQGKLFDFMFLDEVTDNLDLSNSTIFIDLLREIVVQNNRKFFIITHSNFVKDLLEPVISGRIIVKKNNGISSVECDYK